MAATQGGVGFATIYLVCIGPMLWCVLGYLIFVRSRYALLGACIAVIVPYLIGPWSMYLVRRSLGIDVTYFSYWSSLTASLRSVGVDALLYLIVLGYVAWDYRQRFARQA